MRQRYAQMNLFLKLTLRLFIALWDSFQTHIAIVILIAIEFEFLIEFEFPIEFST